MEWQHGAKVQLQVLSSSWVWASRVTHNIPLADRTTAMQSATATVEVSYSSSFTFSERSEVGPSPLAMKQLFG
jgi:hypothetical protein